jgi:hypothetical protein
VIRFLARSARSGGLTVSREIQPDFDSFKKNSFREVFRETNQEHYQLRWYLSAEKNHKCISSSRVLVGSSVNNF